MNRNDSKMEESFGINQGDSRPSSSKSNLTDSSQFIYDEKITRGKLPPLMSKTTESNEFKREDSLILSRSASTISNSNAASTVFPKIDGRFLPK